MRYSHIVNPQTGMGLTDHSLIVVIAKDCTTANSVSTSASVLGPDKGLALAESKRACVRIVRERSAQVEVRTSECFGQFLVP